MDFSAGSQTANVIHSVDYEETKGYLINHYPKLYKNNSAFNHSYYHNDDT